MTADDVRELALLARLRLGEEELQRLAGELDGILAYFGKLAALDTEGVEPMTHAVPMDLPLRDDVVAPSLTADEALANAPVREADFFVVPRAVEKD